MFNFSSWFFSIFVGLGGGGERRENGICKHATRCTGVSKMRLLIDGYNCCRRTKGRYKKCNVRTTFETSCMLFTAYFTVDNMPIKMIPPPLPPHPPTHTHVHMKMGSLHCQLSCFSMNKKSYQNMLQIPGLCLNTCFYTLCHHLDRLGGGGEVRTRKCGCGWMGEWGVGDCGEKRRGLYSALSTFAAVEFERFFTLSFVKVKLLYSALFT